MADIRTSIGGTQIRERISEAEENLRKRLAEEGHLSPNTSPNIPYTASPNMPYKPRLLSEDEQDLRRIVSQHMELKAQVADQARSISDKDATIAMLESELKVANTNTETWKQVAEKARLRELNTASYCIKLETAFRMFQVQFQGVSDNLKKYTEGLPYEEPQRTESVEEVAKRSVADALSGGHETEAVPHEA